MDPKRSLSCSGCESVWVRSGVEDDGDGELIFSIFSGGDLFICVFNWGRLVFSLLDIKTLMLTEQRQNNDF